jgi:hypothetical protein
MVAGFVREEQVRKFISGLFHVVGEVRAVRIGMRFECRE